MLKVLAMCSHKIKKILLQNMLIDLMKLILPTLIMLFKME